MILTLDQQKAIENGESVALNVVGLSGHSEVWPRD